ncbi:MAG: hypothetical protein WA004_17475 [Saprospiraceae bacterium]
MASNPHTKFFLNALLAFAPILPAFSQTIMVVDSASRQPLAFATYQSPIGNCQGYSNAEGKIELDAACTGKISIQYLGYIAREVDVSPGALPDTVAMTPAAYALGEVTVRGAKTDLFREISKAVATYRKRKRQRPAAAFLKIETLNGVLLTERARILSTGLLSTREGYSQEDRKVVGYDFLQADPFLSLDIDRLMLSVRPFSTAPSFFRHVFNERRVLDSATVFQLLEITETEGRVIATVTYRRDDGCYGLFSFDRTKGHLLNHRMHFYQVPKASYQSLNAVIPVTIDSIVLFHQFREGELEDVRFQVFQTFERNEEVQRYQTAGAISILEARPERIIQPPLRRRTIQEDALLSAPWQYNQAFGDFDPGLFGNIPLDDRYIAPNDELAAVILAHHGALSLQFRQWEREKRISPAHFHLAQQAIADPNKPNSFLSDQHRFGVAWIFDPTSENGRLTFQSVPSLWLDKEAALLCPSPYHGVLLANLSFDLFELYRLKTLEMLKDVATEAKARRLVEKSYREAQEMVRTMNQASAFGRDLSGLERYLSMTEKTLMTDNLAALAVFLEKESPDPGAFSPEEGELMYAFFAQLYQLACAQGREATACVFWEQMRAWRSLGECKCR